MSQASERIAQQFIDGGVVPADLSGATAASKTYVDQQLGIRDANIGVVAGTAGAAQVDINQHKASSAAHPAEHITYTGKVPGGNVKHGLDNLSDRVEQIIGEAGDSNPEIVDSRKPQSGSPYPTLKARLDSEHGSLAAQLADIAINVRAYGATGDGVTDDTESVKQAINAARNNGIKAVFIPSGTYRITEKITVNFPIKIIGNGKQKSFIFADQCDAIESTAGDCEFIGFGLLTNGTGFNGLTISGEHNIVDQILLKGETVADDFWSKGIHAVDCWYSAFSNITYIGGNLWLHQRGFAFNSDYSVNNRVSNCDIFAADRCINLSAVKHPTKTHVSEGWTINKNTLIVSNYGVYAEDGTYIDVVDNIIDIMYKGGIHFDISSGGRVSGNWIASAGDTVHNFVCLNIVRGERVSVVGNMFAGSNYNGIIIISGRHTVVGNTVHCEGTGIFVTGENNVIANNIISRSGTYAIYCTGDTCQVQGNIHTGAGSIYVSGVKSQSQYDRWCIASVLVLNGAATQVVDITIPNGVFVRKPTIGIMMCVGGHGIICEYLYDDPGTTITNAKFSLRKADGSPLPSSAVRFSIMLAKDDAIL